MATLICIECASPAAASAEGWQGRLVDLDDDGEDDVALYCPACAEREFGERVTSADT